MFHYSALPRDNQLSLKREDHADASMSTQGAWLLACPSFTEHVVKTMFSGKL